MEYVLKWLKGSPRGGRRLLWLLGLLAVFVGVLSHLGNWSLQTLTDKDMTQIAQSGMQEGGILGFALLGCYLVLFLLGSQYTLLPAILFFVYTLETCIGTHLLRYMPFEHTQLLPALYLGLPLTSLLMLLGGVSTMLPRNAEQRDP